MANAKDTAARLLEVGENIEKLAVWNKNQKVEEARRLVIVRGDQIKMRPVEYLWPLYLMKNALVLWSGESGVAKSVAASDVAARVSAGLDWPDKAKNTNGPRDVLYLASYEDDIDTVVAPRIVAAGGDLSRVHFVTGSCPEKDDGEFSQAIALVRDFKAILAAAESLPELALVIIDPITNALGSATKYTDTQQVRDALTPIVKDVCQKRNVCLLIISHINRRDKSSSSAQQLILGAEAFKGMSRLNFFFAKGKNDDTREYTMAEERNKKAPSQRIRTEAVNKTIPIDGASVEFKDIVVVKWIGTSTETAEELMKGGERTSIIPLLKAQVLHLLRCNLAMKQKDVMTQLRLWYKNTLGLDPEVITESKMKDVLRSAKDSIVSYREKDSWSWKLRPDSKERNF